MDIAPSAKQYPSPPRKWPFGPIGRTGFLIIFLLLLILCLVPFWGSIVVAGIFALGMNRPIGILSAKLGGRRRLVAAGFVVLITLLISFPAAFLSVRTIQVVSSERGKEGGLLEGETASRAQEAYGKFEKTITNYGVGAKLFETTADARTALHQGFTQAGKMIAQGFTAALAMLPELFLTFFVFMLFLYMFLGNPAEMHQLAQRLNFAKPADLEHANKILQASCYNSLVANFLVGILQASIITIGAKAVGYNESVLIFSVVFAISYIPFIGSSPPGFLLALISLALGNTGDAIAMALVATFAGVIDNVVRPYLVSSGEGDVHPVLSFAAILGSIGVFGLKGLFLGPVILTAAVSFLGRTVEKPEEETKA
ncbi:MAG: AI-2E family transporter [Proteobacteria bacterium]|nr:MAG: AI-2E family transporter [Pseudomonadota bacterium]